MRQGSAGCQNLGHLRFFSTSLYSYHLVIPSVYIFLNRHSYSCADFNGKLPSLNDYWGKHCALITGVDKPSRVRQLKPYPTLPYPTLPYSTPPHPTPPLPYPTLPLPYPTLPCPYPTLLYPSPTIPSPTHLTPTTTLPLPYQTLPPPQPYSTILYPINMVSLPFK